MSQKMKEGLAAAVVLLLVVCVGLRYGLYWQLLGVLAGLAVLLVKRAKR